MATSYTSATQMVGLLSARDSGQTEAIPLQRLLELVRAEVRAEINATQQNQGPPSAAAMGEATSGASAHTNHNQPPAQYQPAMEPLIQPVASVPQGSGEHFYVPSSVIQL